MTYSGHITEIVGESTEMVDHVTESGGEINEIVGHNSDKAWDVQCLL
jgi:hypothetical protein